MKRNFIIAAGCLGLLAACATTPIPTPPPAPVAAADVVVPEAWVSDGDPGDGIDSLAAWPTEDGAAWLVASARTRHHLLLLDAATGKRLRTIGERGAKAGQFDRPNGVAIWGDLLFVVERGNRRVQALRLPDFAPLAVFGDDVLRTPYGVWVNELSPQRLELLVTDSFMADSRTGKLPPSGEMDQRVRRFHVDIGDDGDLQARYVGAFGDTNEAGMPRMVESIAGDAAHDRVLVAEEDHRVGSTFRNYTLDGRYRGVDLPRFDAEAGGISLWECGVDEGYWIAGDRTRPTTFRVFDRVTLQPRGTFSGRIVANTGGQALYPAALPGFPAGALFVQSDDRAIAAFDLREIAKALRLDPACVE